MNDAAEFNTSRLVLLSDWAPGTLALVALISLAVLALAWHNVRAQPPFRRNVLLALRGAAVLALFTVFLEPGLRLENVTRVRNHLVVMVDASRSMDLPGYGDTTRLAGVQQALTRASGTLETWRTAHSIDFYAVTDHARPVGRPEEITASGDATRLATGLADLAARHRPDELAGVCCSATARTTARSAPSVRARSCPPPCGTPCCASARPFTRISPGPTSP
jgi:hypothetical protein